MKTYYIMIHWDNSSAVTGFLAPNVNTKQEAILAVKKSLLHRKHLNRTKDKCNELSTPRILKFLKSLKRPWRTYTKWNKTSPVVDVRELTDPVLAGYWLQDINRGENICNIHNISRK